MYNILVQILFYLIFLGDLWYLIIFMEYLRSIKPVNHFLSIDLKINISNLNL